MSRPPSVPVPTHYTAFRLSLLLLVLALLAVLVWWVLDPIVMAEVYDFLGLP
ncbi:hypothetical protein [Pseudonocardia sp. ICBG1034]|uniref:hypothetical protein n=1 Tax=Pseudonocardia sp. ICBG1034 TaxID=2844381 RepID=UPI001CCAD006|nr:hypothetical protein [Pseudonocardia sp. ICBG1034]